MKVWISMVAAVSTLVVAGCREDGAAVAGAKSAAPGAAQTAAPRMHSLSVGVRNVDKAPGAADSAPQPATMSSLTVKGPEVSQSRSGSGNNQSLSVKSPAGSFSQRTQGSGNTQVLNVEANAGTITQRQSGSGNFQSMNIGVVDGPPNPSSAGTARP